MQRTRRIAAFTVVLLLIGLTPATTAATTTSNRHEAEDGTIAQGVLETLHPGYSGAGYVNGDKATGSSVEWTVSATAVGTAALTFGYANGTATSRPADITVNGSVVAAHDFPSTGSWPTWATTTLTAELSAGTNTIRLTATTANGNANLDYLDVGPEQDPEGGTPSGVTTLSSGWTIPWGVGWLPDGQTALITERGDYSDASIAPGRVYRTTLTGARTFVGTVPDVVLSGGEGGMLGVAIDPAWTSNHFVYFFHTAAEGNRIARMTYDGTTLTGYTIIVRGIARNTYHNGGRLAFGPDGFLYATTGDAQNTASAQDTGSLNGKILRMTTAGAPAPGNPFGTLVYSYGHRNPQGLAFDRNGRLWSAEFGANAYDELNLIKPGANYGWPTCEGSCTVSGMTNPKAQWPVSQASPSGIAIVRNVIYMAAQRGERLWRIPITGDTEDVGTPSAYYVGAHGRLRTPSKVPGADHLWLTTTNADTPGGRPDGSDVILRVTIT